MDIDLIFKIAAIGIIVSILNQVLSRSGRDEQAMLLTVGGILAVMLMLLDEISSVIETVRVVFGL